MQPIPFIGAAYQTRSVNYSAQKCINLYLEPGIGKSPALLVGCPGLTAPWATLTGGGIRGLYVVDPSTAVAVCGGNVYQLTTGGASTPIGTVGDDGNPVRMAHNDISGNTVVVIASAGSLYSVTVGGVASAVVKAGCTQVEFFDDHFVTVLTGTGLFAWSDATSTNFDALSVQATNGAPDTLVGVSVSRRIMYLFGTKSIEQWYDQGGSGNPFSRIDGAFYEVGCIATNSIAKLDGVFWLSGDEKGAGSVWTCSGGAPSRISTPAIEFAISRWPDMTDARAFTYSQEGHAFYVLSSESGNETWVYDITTRQWHQRAALVDGELTRIRPDTHMYFAGQNLVGDWENGNIYGYDLGTYTDNGEPMPAIRSCSTLQQGLDEQRSLSFQLDMDTGVGLESGKDPKAMLRWSKDGGNTWSNEIWRSFGKVGEYTKRCLWHRVGGGRRSVFEVKITDPVKRNITGAYIG